MSLFGRRTPKDVVMAKLKNTHQRISQLASEDGHGAEIQQLIDEFPNGMDKEQLATMPTVLRELMDDVERRKGKVAESKKLSEESIGATSLSHYEKWESRNQKLNSAEALVDTASAVLPFSALEWDASKSDRKRSQETLAPLRARREKFFRDKGITDNDKRYQGVVLEERNAERERYEKEEREKAERERRDEERRRERERREAAKPEAQKKLEALKSSYDTEKFDVDAHEQVFARGHYIVSEFYTQPFDNDKHREQVRANLDKRQEKLRSMEKEMNSLKAELRNERIR